MPRVAKSKVEDNEPVTTEIGLVGLVSNQGKTTWAIVRQNVTASGHVVDYVDLMEDTYNEDGSSNGQRRILVSSKAAALAWIRGYDYARSEAEENE